MCRAAWTGDAVETGVYTRALPPASGLSLDPVNLPSAELRIA
jgi:hypothetical protein